MGVKQERKKQAKELALLLYDIYKEKSAKDKQKSRKE